MLVDYDCKHTLTNFLNENKRWVIHIMWWIYVINLFISE